MTNGSMLGFGSLLALLTRRDPPPAVLLFFTPRKDWYVGILYRLNAPADPWQGQHPRVGFSLFRCLECRWITFARVIEGSNYAAAV